MSKEEDEDVFQFTIGKVVPKKRLRRKTTLEKKCDILSSFPTCIENKKEENEEVERKPKKQRTTAFIPSTSFDLIPAQKKDYFIDPVQWITGTAVKNYLMKDPLLDWISLYYHSIPTKDARFTKVVQEASSLLQQNNSNKKEENFTSYIMEQGNQFERRVIDLLWKRFSTQETIDIGGNHWNAKSKEKFQMTVDAMKRGIPLIYSGVLHSDTYKYYGVPDLLVRSDYLERLVNVSVFKETKETESISTKKYKKRPRKMLESECEEDSEEDEEYIPTKRSKKTDKTDKIDRIDKTDKKKDTDKREHVSEKYNGCFWQDTTTPSKKRKWHYRVVDIKFTTLLLKSDGFHLLNAGLFPAYKAQLYIYNTMLSEIQGYEAPCSYILGRKWKFTKKSIQYRGNQCFDRLAIINYHSVDMDIVEKVRRAVQWLRDVRMNGHSWNILSSPLPKEELYPNLANGYDYPWHSVKEKIAEELKDITQLWMCGAKQRQYAHEKHQLYQWTDPRCCPETLNVTGPFISKVLSKLLEVNHNKDPNVRVWPLKIENNMKEWKTKRDVEFFVDFETINDVFGSFDSLPFAPEIGNLIFMIGVGFVSHVEKEKGLEPHKWNYTCFIVKDFTREEEHFICKKFVDFVQFVKNFYQIDSSLLWHWSHAEPNIWEHSSIEVEERSGEIEKIEIADQWCDLLKIFKSEPIIVKGALDFGLKSISGALRQLGCISSAWNSGCQGGTQAMLLAHKANRRSKRDGIPLYMCSEMREIETYNEIDCKVIFEILQYLRQHHI